MCLKLTNLNPLLISTASGRAITNGRFDAVTKLVFEDSTKAHGHGKTIDPTLGDSIGMVAEAALGSCTDVPLGKK